MDALSHLLQLYPAHVAVDHACNLGSPWSLDSPASPFGIAPYHVVTNGCAWLTIEGEKPLHLQTGDIVVLPSGAPHSLSASGPGQPSLARKVSGGVLPVIVNDGVNDRSELLCGSFNFEPNIAGILFASLPSLLHIRQTGGSDLDSMRSLITLLRNEHRMARPGSAMILAQLASSLFAMILRAWLTQAPEHRGMLALLSDPRLRRGFTAILENPGHPWSVDELADTCNVSRATFARHFVKATGITPGDLLMRIRMARAVQWLQSERHNIAMVADAVGYQSEAAFSRAFTRFYGSAPGAYRRQQGSGLGTS